ncbi:MAG: ABC transporter permease subunit, partial [Clostridia bacterium]|nr:ABC transporter permease subunit [Clostridia bacterium]
MFAVYHRELSSYFTTPIGFVFAAMFVATSGLAFCVSTLLANTSDVNGYFRYLVLIFAILLPLLTMKSFSEERKTKTEQLLLTSPVSLFGIVFGKFLASVTVLAVSLIVNSFSFVILARYGSVNGTVVFGNIIAIFFIGMAFIAAGIFISSFTENQFIAADA